jgi:uncharacterized protein YjbJ (UPF0337 family)
MAQSQGTVHVNEAKDKAVQLSQKAVQLSQGLMHSVYHAVLVYLSIYYILAGAAVGVAEGISCNVLPELKHLPRASHQTNGVASDVKPKAERAAGDAKSKVQGAVSEVQSKAKAGTKTAEATIKTNARK